MVLLMLSLYFILEFNMFHTMPIFAGILDFGIKGSCRTIVSKTAVYCYKLVFGLICLDTEKLFVTVLFYYLLYGQI